MTAVPLHTQLDRFEALQLGQAAPVSEPERLKQTVAEVYGVALPSEWENQVISPTAQVDRSSDLPKEETPAALSSLPQTREGWLAWIKKPYQRPIQRAQWQTTMQQLQALAAEDKRTFDQWDAWRGLTGIPAFLVGFSLFPTLLLGTLPWLCGEGVTLALLIAGYLYADKKARFTTPFYREPPINAWLNALQEAAVSEEDLHQWAQYPEVAQQAVHMADSEVPLLKGDVAHLHQMTKHFEAQRGMKQAWDGLRAVAG